MLVFLTFIGFAASINVSPNTNLFCPDHSPQRSFETRLLMGTWYVVEIVDHKDHGQQWHHQVDLNFCPRVELTQEHQNNIRIKWMDYDVTAYYNAKITVNANGSWIASGPHQDYHPHTHYQYSGKIEVMKAVSNHMVLTFCKASSTDGQLFSAVLSREPSLPRIDISGVNRMLTQRKLEPWIVKRACGSASSATNSAFVLFVFIWTVVPGNIWFGE